MNILRNLIILCMFALLTACAATKPQKVEKGRPSEETKGIVEDLDPLAFSDDDFIIEIVPSKTYMPEKKGTSAAEGETEKDTTKTYTMGKVLGYQVQIAALSNQDEAMEIQKTAMLKFIEDVYLIFDSPYYKVRVGNCITRDLAEALQKKAVRLGFPDAWIIRTMVKKKE